MQKSMTTSILPLTTVFSMIIKVDNKIPAVEKFEVFKFVCSVC